MTVSIIVPNWNGRSLLEGLLRSIERQCAPDGVRVETIIADNGSSDGSAGMAESRGCRVLRLERNLGVSRALNRGIEAASGEWIALVNNDVELSPQWLALLLQAAGRSGAWFATGRILDFSDRSRLDGAGDAICRGGASWRVGNGKADGPLFHSSRPVHLPSATATLFRRSYFDRVGSLEENFFAYLEDVDLGLRGALAELEGVYVPEAAAWHRGSATAGAWSRASVEWITCHQLLLLAKFYPAALLWRYARPIFVAQFLWALMAVSRGRALPWLKGVLRGLARFRGLRKASGALRVLPARLAQVLEAGEREIAAAQEQTGWDTYWKWYFRLTSPLEETPA